MPSAASISASAGAVAVRLRSASAACIIPRVRNLVAAIELILLDLSQLSPSPARCKKLFNVPIKPAGGELFRLFAMILWELQC